MSMIPVTPRSLENELVITFRLNNGLCHQCGARLFDIVSTSTTTGNATINQRKMVPLTVGGIVKGGRCLYCHPDRTEQQQQQQQQQQPPLLLPSPVESSGKRNASVALPHFEEIHDPDLFNTTSPNSNKQRCSGHKAMKLTQQEVSMLNEEPDHMNDQYPPAKVEDCSIGNRKKRQYVKSGNFSKKGAGSPKKTIDGNGRGVSGANKKNIPLPKVRKFPLDDNDAVQDKVDERKPVARKKTLSKVKAKPKAKSRKMLSSTTAKNKSAKLDHRTTRQQVAMQIGSADNDEDLDEENDTYDASDDDDDNTACFSNNDDDSDDGESYLNELSGHGSEYENTKAELLEQFDTSFEDDNKYNNGTSQEESFTKTIQLRDRDGDVYVGFIIEGDERKGKAHVKCRESRFDGTSDEQHVSVYKGEYENGYFEGEGYHLDAAGCLYRGDFHRGASHGKGICVWPSGWMYDGEWKYDSREGFGTSTQLMTGGEVYSGNWKNDQWHGHGELKYAGGDIYSGEFCEGNIQGHGKYVFSDGSVYVGSFVADVRCGKGEMTYNDGSKYIGEWKNNWREGKGRLIELDGTIYEGIYSADEKVDGIITKPDGKIQTVRNGKIQK